jgi:hypothetical protein
MFNLTIDNVSGHYYIIKGKPISMGISVLPFDTNEEFKDFIETPYFKELEQLNKIKIIKDNFLIECEKVPTLPETQIFSDEELEPMPVYKKKKHK